MAYPYFSTKGYRVYFGLCTYDCGYRINIKVVISGERNLPLSAYRTMIIGEYRQTIGDKNRIAFPKTFRNDMGDLLIITKGYEGCLAIMTPAQWKELVTDVVSGPFVSSLIRDTSRFLLASASQINLDAQGRFVIPPYLVEYAKLKKNGVFLGLEKWVELWELTLWEEKKKELNDMSSITGEKLAGLRLSQNNDKT